MPTSSTLIIVNGAPGTGKTHLSQRLAKELRLPLLNKDDIKEALFETLGTGDRVWSRKLGGASFDVFFALLERQLEAGVLCIAETAFNLPFNTPRLLALKAQYGFHPFQIYCHADPAVLAPRINQRMATGERHPGHGDGAVTVEGIEQGIAEGRYGILDIGGTLVKVDTTDFGAVDFEGLVAQVRATL